MVETNNVNLIVVIFSSFLSSQYIIADKSDFKRGVEVFDYFGVDLIYKPERREATEQIRSEYYTWSFPVVVACSFCINNQ